MDSDRTSRDLSVTVALAALSVTIAAAFGLVLRGDRWVLPLVTVALLPHVVSAVARALHRSSPVIDVGASLLLLAAGAVILVGPAPDAIVDAIRDGVDMLGRNPPVAATDGVILVAAGVVWGAATVADQVTFHHDGSVGAVAPGVVVMIGFASNDVTTDVWLPVSAFAIAAIVYLALQHRRLLERQRTWIGARPTARDALWLAASGLVVGIVAVALSVGGAVALIDADRPLIDFGSLAARGDSPTSYRAKVAPVVRVGDDLRQPEPANLFTVRADEPAYWRLSALDQYVSDNGGQWVLEAKGDEVSDSLDDAVPDDALVQQYEVGPAMADRWIPAAYRAVDVDGVDVGLVVPESATLVSRRPSIANTTYTVRSKRPPDASEINRPAAQAAVPDDVAQFAELPDDIPPIVTETARAVAGDLADPVAKAEALRDFFRDPSFVYDVNVGFEDGAAAIDTFLRERRGYCVQFATAYALMARSLGIPARLALGFNSGTFDETTGRYVVSTSDAHAWPELYFTGTGWATPFDPTPPADGVSPGGSTLPGEVAPDTSATTTPQTAPPQTSPPTSPPATTPSSDGSTPGSTPTDNGGSVSIDSRPQSDDQQPVIPLVALLVLLVLLLLAPLIGVLAWKRRRRARRRHTSDRAAAIVGAWTEALDTLAEHRVPSSDSDTPLEVATRVTRSTTEATWRPMSSLASTYNQARYGSAAPSDEQVEAAWHDVDELRVALDERLGPLQKVRTRLSLRAMGRARRTASGDLSERTPEPV